MDNVKYSKQINNKLLQHEEYEANYGGNINVLELCMKRDYVARLTGK